MACIFYKGHDPHDYTHGYQGPYVTETEVCADCSWGDCESSGGWFWPVPCSYFEKLAQINHVDEDQYCSGLNFDGYCCRMGPNEDIDEWNPEETYPRCESGEPEFACSDLWPEDGGGIWIPGDLINTTFCDFDNSPWNTFEGCCNNLCEHLLGWDGPIDPVSKTPVRSTAPIDSIDHFRPDGKIILKSDLKNRIPRSKKEFDSFIRRFKKSRDEGGNTPIINPNAPSGNPLAQSGDPTNPPDIGGYYGSIDCYINFVDCMEELCHKDYIKLIEIDKAHCKCIKKCYPPVAPKWNQIECGEDFVMPDDDDLGYGQEKCINICTEKRDRDMEAVECNSCYGEQECNYQNAVCISQLPPQDPAHIPLESWIPTLCSCYWERGCVTSTVPIPPDCAGDGACCVGDPASVDAETGCVESMSAEDCITFGGNFLGGSSTCDDCPIHTDQPLPLTGGGAIGKLGNPPSCQILGCWYEPYVCEHDCPAWMKDLVDCDSVLPGVARSTNPGGARSMNPDTSGISMCNCVFGWDGTEPMYEGSYDHCLDNIPRIACEDPDSGGFCLNASCSLTFDWCECGFDGLDDVCFGMLPSELCEGAGGSCSSNACNDFTHPNPGEWWSCVTINEWGNCECTSINPAGFGGVIPPNHLENAIASCEAEGGTFSTDDCGVVCPRPEYFDLDFWACINSLRDKRETELAKCTKKLQYPLGGSRTCESCCQDAKAASCLLTRLCYLEFDAQHGTNWGEQKYQECMDRAFDCGVECSGVVVHKMSNRSNKERQMFWEKYSDKK